MANLDAELSNGREGLDLFFFFVETVDVSVYLAEGWVHFDATWWV